MDQLLGIGDYAQLVGPSVSAVRFYADRRLLVPARIDPSTGYRSFDPDQIPAGRLVRDLRLIGGPLAQVKAALGLPADRVQQLVDVHIAGLGAELQEAHRTARNLGSSTDPEQPHLMTVLIEVQAGSVRIVTTDTHRLAVRDLVALGAGVDFTALISAAAARRWLTWLRPRHEVRLRLDGGSLIASDGEVSTSVRVVPAEFPDYGTFLTPRDDSTVMIVDRQEFSDALQRFDDAAGGVRLSASQNQLRIRRRNASAKVKGEHDGIDAHVVIDPKYGCEAATSAIGSELAIELDCDPLRPVLVRSATNGTFVSLLMPIKMPA